MPGYLCGWNKVKMKMTTLAQCINQVDWPRALNLTRNLGDNGLDLKYDLENLDIGATLVAFSSLAVSMIP